jgi:hypothetical protein
MSQKSRFKMQTQGITTFRNTFPQLPGGTLKKPEFIQTAHGQVFRRFSTYQLSYFAISETAFSSVAGGDTLANL